MQPTVTNIAAYQFFTLPDPKRLRTRLLALCKEQNLQGTILLSTEGINLFVAGSRPSIDLLLAELRSIPGLENLTPKFSESAEQPFRRMLVRIKKEIIAFGVDGIDPARRTSPKLAPRVLKEWLDEGRPVTLLDTRNDYEVKLGTFRGAQTLQIDHFREFPAAVDTLPEEWKEQPIVMFCTGGIRCEKAGPYMEREGFQKVYQLDGGILKYFEDCGGAHYDGECFVFDQRVGVDPALRETDSAQCFACQSPLTPREQTHPHYVKGVSCPFCFPQKAELEKEALAQRNAILKRVTCPLPGSTPHDLRRTFRIPCQYDRRTLLEFLEEKLSHHSTETWSALFHQGRLIREAGERVGENQIIRSGERYAVLLPQQIEPAVNAAIRVLFEDEAILVVNKPAPLPVHAGGRFHRNTLQYFLNLAYAPHHPRPAHRLDANTTGLLVCARTKHFARILQPQFEAGTVGKVYLAKVTGTPDKDTFLCEAPISDLPGIAGSRTVDVLKGQPSRTHFQVLQRFQDGTTLLEVRPETGRTNQIRIHLQHLGYPICGDQIYQTDGPKSNSMTSDPDTTPLCLHAWKLSFDHPVHKERVSFTSEKPDWAEVV